MSKEQLNHIRLLLERLDAAVVVRDPGNARSAEAFDGLRKSILVSSKNHRTHIAHLLSLSDSLDRGAGLDLIRERVGDFLFELGVKHFEDVTYPEMFEITEILDGEADALEVLHPAVIEQLENGDISLIRLGKARQIRGPEQPPTETEIPIVSPLVTLTAAESSDTSGRSIWLSRIAVLVAGVALGLLVSSVFGGSDSETDSPNTTIAPSVTTSSTLTPSTSSTLADTTTTTIGE